MPKSLQEDNIETNKGSQKKPDNVIPVGGPTGPTSNNTESGVNDFYKAFLKRNFGIKESDLDFLNYKLVNFDVKSGENKFYGHYRKTDFNIKDALTFYPEGDKKKYLTELLESKDLLEQLKSSTGSPLSLYDKLDMIGFISLDGDTLKVSYSNSNNKSLDITSKINFNDLVAMLGLTIPQGDRSFYKELIVDSFLKNYTPHGASLKGAFYNFLQDASVLNDSGGTFTYSELYKVKKDVCINNSKTIDLGIILDLQVKYKIPTKEMTKAVGELIEINDYSRLNIPKIIEYTFKHKKSLKEMTGFLSRFNEVTSSILA